MSSSRYCNMLFITFIFFSFNAIAAVDPLIIKGKVHLSGSLVEGGCTPSPSFKDTFVDMGNYNNQMFSYPGEYSSESISFSIKLQDCSVFIRDMIKIVFYGKNDSTDPLGFEATTLNGDKRENSGLTLSLFDSDHNLIMPNKEFTLNKLKQKQVESKYNFIARYKANRKDLYPGYLNTDVWFTVQYP